MQTTHTYGPKLFIMQFKPFLIILLFCFCLIYSSEATGNEYGRISMLSKEICDEQETIGHDAIISNLMQIRLLRSRMDNAVALNARGRKYILIGLCLHKLVMEIGLDKCYQSRGNYQKNHYKDNWHANNYIEIKTILDNYFKTDNMRNFINIYYKMQLEMCQHNILVGFNVKYDQSVEQYKNKIKEFIPAIVGCFPPEIQLNDLDREQRIDAVINYLLDFHKRKGLVEFARVNIFTGLSVLVNNVVNSNCMNFALNPLHTIMMTYDTMNRDVEQVQETYGQWIRAYDICSMLSKKLDTGDFKEIEKRLYKILGISKEQNIRMSGFENKQGPSKRSKQMHTTLWIEQAPNQENQQLITQTNINPLSELMAPIEPNYIETMPHQEQPNQSNQELPNLQLNLGSQTRQEQQQQRVATNIIPRKGLTFDLGDDLDKQDHDRHQLK